MHLFASLIASIVALFPVTAAAPVLPITLRPLIQPHATVLFGGDMMFDRSIRVAMQKNGTDFVFSCFGDLLKSADLTVANLEGPVTARASKSVGTAAGELNNTRFTFASTTAPLLRTKGIDVVSLGNNHARDFGGEGIVSTMQILDAASVGHFGDPLGESVFKTTINGVPISLIGYNEFQELQGGEWKGSTSTIAHVRAARGDGYLPVVFAHWGDEYVAANPKQKRLAREFIDAGAELVVGAHPHVVQEHEIYEGKHMYYSLGNLIFDQYWNDEVSHGLLLRVELDLSGVQNVEEIPVQLGRDRRTCPVE